jgi:hypothetical protein
MISFLLSGLFLLTAFTSGFARQTVTENRAPETIPEAVEHLFHLIPNKEIAIIRRTTEEEFATNAVATLGVYMREEWKLYSTESELALFFMRNDIINPDEMSEIILICLWRRVNGRDMEIDRLILDRMRFWDSVRSQN